MQSQQFNSTRNALPAGVNSDFERVANIGETIRKMAEQYRRLAGNLKGLQSEAF